MKSNKLIRVTFLLPMLLLYTASWAQDAGKQAAESNLLSNLFSNTLVIVTLIVLIAAIGVLFYVLNVMIKAQQLKIYEEQGMEAYLEEAKKPKENLWNRLYKKWTNVVPVEKEKDILFDHNYDGIRELDNSLPPWWTAMFYITIAIAVVYFGYYHIANKGMGSIEAYEAEMQQAEEAIQAHLAKQANIIDETNVEALEDEDALARGKAIFETLCAACHGFLGEGGVGPNFTDRYWVHGGSIEDLFKTIKYGVPEKGMISWKAQLRPNEMNEVASYILTLVGSNPPNQKAPEGELYEGDTTPPADTTNVIGMN